MADLKIFLPFSINLDPYIKKVIKEEIQGMEEMGLTVDQIFGTATMLNPPKSPLAAAEAASAGTYSTSHYGVRYTSQSNLCLDMYYLHYLVVYMPRTCFRISKK